MKRELWLVTVLLLLSLTIVSGRGGGAVRGKVKYSNVLR